jgi:hypothetical protein
MTPPALCPSCGQTIVIGRYKTFRGTVALKYSCLCQVVIGDPLEEMTERDRKRAAALKQLAKEVDDAGLYFPKEKSQ